MNERAPFLRAIRDDPESDEPRLVYADWLEEQDDPRAEFIRAQCELARLNEQGEGDSDRARELKLRAEAIARQHAATWRPWEAKPEIPRWQYVRGFLHSLNMTITQFLNDAETILAHEPVYEFGIGGIRNTQHRMTEMAEHPAVQEIRWLNVGSNLQDDCLATLVASPNLASLRRLMLDHSRCRKKCLAALERADLPHLESLDLSHTSLAKVPPIRQFPQLKRLFVGHNARVKSLSPAAGHSELRELHAPVSGVKDLQLIHSLSRLEVLVVSQTDVDDLWPLADHPSLRVVKLAGNPVTDIEPLFRLPRLQTAMLHGCEVPDSRLKELDNHIAHLRKDADRASDEGNR